jgi:hypothetical protein
LTAVTVEGNSGEKAEAALQKLGQDVAWRLRVIAAQLQHGQKSTLHQLRSHEKMLPQFNSTSTGA